MAASVTLKREQPVQSDPEEPQGYWLTITATQATDMPTEVFVMQSGVQWGEDQANQFVNVASPNDIEEIPPTAPNDDDNPYFRVAELTLCFRSAVELEDTWGYIKEDVQGLVEALKSLDNLEEVEEVTF